MKVDIREMGSSKDYYSGEVRTVYCCLDVKVEWVSQHSDLVVITTLKRHKVKLEGGGLYILSEEEETELEPEEEQEEEEELRAKGRVLLGVS